MIVIAAVVLGCLISDVPVLESSGAQDSEPLRVALTQSPQTVGAVAGCATDRSGGVLPGVTFTATREGASRQAVTDVKGCYVIPKLEPAVYSVEAKLAGFKSLTRPNVEVRAGETTQVDASLCLAGIMEHVWVLPRSFEELVKSSDAVVHVRITSTRLEPECENIWFHAAQVLQVIKSGAGAIPSSIEFSQWRSGLEQVPYSVGTELVMGISAREGKPFERTGGPFGVYVVRDGHVVRGRDWGTNRFDNMALNDFISALRGLVK